MFQCQASQASVYLLYIEVYYCKKESCFCFVSLQFNKVEVLTKENSLLVPKEIKIQYCGLNQEADGPSF